jgi:nicotinamide mononucleotide adenylyltransferase
MVEQHLPSRAGQYSWVDRVTLAVCRGSKSDTARKTFSYQCRERPLRAISGRSRMRVYSILALLPVETDGRLRNRIKSNEENFERIVIEDSLSRLN